MAVVTPPSAPSTIFVPALIPDTRGPSGVSMPQRALIATAPSVAGAAKTSPTGPASRATGSEASLRVRLMTDPSLRAPAADGMMELPLQPAAASAETHAVASATARVFEFIVVLPRRPS